MSFADRYINRNIVYPPFIEEAPASTLGMVVVIPCYDEPEIRTTLESLKSCQPPNCQLEVLVVINHSELSSPEVVAQNAQTAQQLHDWKEENRPCFFQLHVIQAPPFRKKHAGAGLARKTGMDEAIRRFTAIDFPDGVIVSLDADTNVDQNYFCELEQHFQSFPKQVGATIRFKHRTEELDDERHRQGMGLYEDYLHYYKQAMAYTGFPHAIYTIGSAFAVRALPYVKQGGMNRKQAGEDFYFLHKLTQVGEIGEITTTCVYPSARISHRVPFGTGPVLKKWLEGEEALRETYNFQAFDDLKQLFDLLEELYQSSSEDCPGLLAKLPGAVRSFLQADNFEAILMEIKENSARFDSFQKRFFLNFNAFKILKYLNFVHPAFFEMQELGEAIQLLAAHDQAKTAKSRKGLSF